MKLQATVLFALISSMHAETLISLDALRINDPKSEFTESLEMVMSNEFETSLIARFTEKTGAREISQNNDIIKLAFNPLQYQIACSGIAGFEKEAEECFWTLFLEERRDHASKRRDEEERLFDERVHVKWLSYDDTVEHEKDGEKLKELREVYRNEINQLMELRSVRHRSLSYPNWRIKRTPSEEALRIEEAIDATRIFSTSSTFQMTEHHQKLMGTSEKQVERFNDLSVELWESISTLEKNTKSIKRSRRGIEAFIPKDDDFIEPLKEDYLRSVRRIFEPQILVAKYTRTFIKNLEHQFWKFGKDRVISMRRYTGTKDRPGAVTFSADWIHEGRQRNCYSGGGASYKIPEEYIHLFNSIEEAQPQQ